jgi:hypothetical protein
MSTDKELSEGLAVILEPAFFDEHSQKGWEPDHVIQMQEKGRAKGAEVVA